MKTYDGPWKMENRENERGDIVGINITSDNFVICKLPDGASIDGGFAFPNQLDNAKLIESAPRLLDACQILSAACESLMGEVIGKSITDWGLVNDALILSAKAIKKATVEVQPDC